MVSLLDVRSKDWRVGGSRHGLCIVSCCFLNNFTPGGGGGDPAPALMSHLARSILKVGRGGGR